MVRPRLENSVSLERLREVLRYDPDTGHFYCAGKRKRMRKSGLAGTLERQTGYWKILIDGRFYLAHRLAWFYMTGAWPVDQMDHINGVRHDNRFANLREADAWINARNQRRSPDGRGPYHFSRLR